jgi:hypothetical protein
MDAESTGPRQPHKIIPRCFPGITKTPFQSGGGVQGIDVGEGKRAGGRQQEREDAGRTAMITVTDDA